MPKQFLLNPDGSVPANTNIELLQEQGIPLVLPTPMPRQAGMVAIEQEPEQDADGVWRQVWTLEPAPEPIQQEVDPLASLTEEQKQAIIQFLAQNTQQNG